MTAGAAAVGEAPGVKRRRRARAAPTPSFAFVGKALEESGGSAAGAEQTSHVEVFKTVAGVAGKRGSNTTRITMEEAERAMPVTFVRHLLPTPFADHLLRVFLAEGEHWHTSKRWLYDKEIESHRLESGFRFNDRGQLDGQGFSRRWEAAGFGDDLRHLRQVVAGAVQNARAQLRRGWRAARGGATEETAEGGAVLTASELAQETVALASRGQKLDASSAEWLVRYAHEFAMKSWRWEPNYCVGNLYKDEGDFLGAHSDPVASIGPWAIVASLTFGAARQFRMKPAGTVREGRAGGGHVTSYSIRLPHNSLLICWEGFQEFWRHEVPKDHGLTRHPISGAARLNFTFRKSQALVARRRPLCRCGRKAHFKPVLKESSRNRGRYFWSCPTPRVKTGVYSSCDFFQWDDELLTQHRTSAQPTPQNAPQLKYHVSAPAAPKLPTLAAKATPSPSGHLLPPSLGAASSALPGAPEARVAAPKMASGLRKGGA